MNLATMQFLSQSLGRHVTYTVILPDARHGEGPFPVLYQLHGRSDDHTAWVVLGGLVRHLAPYPLIAVLPDGGVSGWRNRSRNERYEDFVVGDLTAHVRASFHVRPGRAAIGGLSMGGAGAIRLGLKHPDLFCSIWAHSSGRMDRERLREGGATEAEVDADDVHAQAARLMQSPPAAGLPRLAFDCGVDDRLLDGNRALHRHLEGIGFPHTYREHPGAHTWDYWTLHVGEALRQHAEALGIERA